MMIELNTGWKCIQCGKEQRNKGNNNNASKNPLKMHIELEHMGISQTCEMCGHTYKNKGTFRNHLSDGSCKAKDLAIFGLSPRSPTIDQ